MKKWKFAIAILALTVALTACGNDDEATKEKTNETDVAGEQATNEATGQYPMTISPTITSTETEEAGTVSFEDVTFESMPEKIVVFDYGFLDTLDTLGVEGVVGVP
ncbi:hypothetical protein NXY55_25125, partial [Aeromonas veronii]|nr:hypothetical protein [Aeromonas veronii]